MSNPRHSDPDSIMFARRAEVLYGLAVNVTCTGVVDGCFVRTAEAATTTVLPG